MNPVHKIFINIFIFFTLFSNILGRINTNDLKEISNSILKELEMIFDDIEKGVAHDIQSIPIPPMNISMDFNNSTVSLPMQLYADRLNISDVRMYSPNVKFPLTFNSKNMSYEIDIHSDSLPMTISLNSNNSVIPLQLAIKGENQIPVTVAIDRMSVPLFNWIVIGSMGSLLAICLGLIIYQHCMLLTLKRRLDDIDISNQVFNGKRVRIGQRWYSSINNGDTGDDMDESDNSISINNNSSTNNNSFSDYMVQCQRCRQINGKTNFCFQCGNPLQISSTGSGLS